jgi:hypothetical protein
LSDDDWEKELPETLYGLLTLSQDWREKHEDKTDEKFYSGLLLREPGQGRSESKREFRRQA